ncbi:SDR family oxidoreductase [Candidatus Woesearchaeota archaeon]|nr:SDR family oxidoreductase [Candidatus Woesearchaeota archaeon]
MRLAKKTALVTGGSKGIGEAITKRFLKEGARVIVFDIEKPTFDVEFFKVDISDENQIKEALKKIDKIDVLVNNAGIYFLESVETTSKEQLDTIFDINIKGTYLMCKHFIPLVLKSKGNIINIASALGIVPELSSPAYCSTKAAVIMLTKCLAQEYASKGIRVNSILPGPIDTPLLRNSFKTKEDKKISESKIPMRRIGKPEEVANVAVFLASDEASYVTGGMYSVDGGESTSSVYSK